MASFFKQLSDDMEKVATLVGEGAKFMMEDGQQKMGEDNADPTMTGGGEEGGLYDGDEDGEGFFDDRGSMDGIPYDSPLMGMADNVMSDIMSTQVGPQSSREHIEAFTAAITWSEPFIKLLLAFNVLVIVAAIVLSRKGGMYSRMGLMIFVGIIVRLSEYLNTIGNARWREFATQNYFDRNGIFMGIMVCAPLLCVCLFMLISMIREASNLLGDVQLVKMKAMAKQKEKKEEKQKKKKDEKRRKKRD